MATERLLVLASSRKHGGRCIAGLSLDGNGLIRPVSDHGDRELSSDDTQLSTAPNELDVVSFSHDGYEGDLVQPELDELGFEVRDAAPRRAPAQSRHKPQRLALQAGRRRSTFSLTYPPLLPQAGLCLYGRFRRHRRSDSPSSPANCEETRKFSSYEHLASHIR